MPPVRFVTLALGVSPFAKQIHHRRHAKKLSHVPEALPWEHPAEHAKKAFRREADK
jgi:hypothetical protein